MSTVQQEHVLVVPTQLFHDLGHFQGFTQDVDKYLSTLLDPSHTAFHPRDVMEKTPAYKQLIPYVLFEYDNEGEVELFQYTRGKGQGESRLHSKKSIGIGGHISSLDVDGDSVYENGMQRELDEETRIETEYTSRRVGMINDDENEVGKVHLGVVHIFQVNSRDVFAREEAISDPGFLPLQTIMQEIDRYETWSQICLNALYGPNSQQS